MEEDGSFFVSFHPIVGSLHLRSSFVYRRDPTAGLWGHYSGVDLRLSICDEKMPCTMIVWLNDEPSGCDTVFRTVTP